MVCVFCGQLCVSVGELFVMDGVCFVERCVRMCVS